MPHTPITRARLVSARRSAFSVMESERSDAKDVCESDSSFEAHLQGITYKVIGARQVKREAL